MKTVLLTFTFTCLYLLTFANDTLKTKQANQWLQNAPLQFTENKGQITENGKLRTDILYTVKSNGLDLYLTNHSIQYIWKKVEYKKQAKKDKSDERDLPEIDKITTQKIEMHLLNANPHTQIIAEGESQFIQHFYNVLHAPEGIKDVKSYTKIIYKEIYPKIDLVFYTGTSQSGLKYDFLVHPGGNPKKIQIQYSGQDTLYLDNQGNLTLKHGLGELTEAAPYTYQGNTPIPCHYKLTKAPPSGAGGLTPPLGVGGLTPPLGVGGLAFISFALGDYDTMLPLTIDPDLIWATYYGGSEQDFGTVATDSQGNVYLGGYTASSNNIDFNATTPYDTYQLNGDAFLVKFNSEGTRQWATYYGGNDYEYAVAGAVDSQNNIYLVGYTYSDNNIASNNVYQNIRGGGADGFLVKFNSSGVRQWATYFGGSLDEYSYAAAVDNQDNIYMGGSTKSANNIELNGHQKDLGGLTDAFLVKFNSAGTRQWSTYYGGSLLESTESIATDSQNNIYMCGSTVSTDNIAFNAQAPYDTRQNSYDAFLVKFNASGVRQWATYYGGDGIDLGNGVNIDGQDNVYLAGQTDSNINIFNILLGGHQSIMGGTKDAFIVKFNASGVRQWATYYGGSGTDSGYDVATDNQDNVYLAGYTESTDNIALEGYQNSLGGANPDRDAFIVKFNSTGQRIWGTYYGGSSNDEGTSLAIDSKNNIYLGGYAYSINNIAFNGHQTTKGGSQDAFLAKFCTIDYNPMVSIQASDADLKICNGESLTLTAQVQNNTDSPQRVWRRNGLFISNDNVVSSTDFNNGDVISLELVYSDFENGYDDACIKNNTVSVVLEVRPIITPTVSIVVEPAGIICQGKPVTFQADTLYGGANPQFQWKRKNVGQSNFSNVGNNSITYEAFIVSIGDIIRVEMTNTDIPNCTINQQNKVVSPDLIVSTTLTLTASVKITSDVLASQSICNGDTLRFYADDIINGGDAPRFIWKVNNVIKDTTNTPEFSTHLFNANANNVVSVALLSSYPCLTNANNTTTFADFAFSTKGVVTPVVTLQALDGTAICYGEYARFKANPINGGIEPLYQWFINGNPVGDLDTKDIFASITLQDEDTIQVSMISDLTCATPKVANSNPIIMQVSSAPTVSVSLMAGSPICQGSSLTFTATPQNAGSNVSYQWLKNGQEISGANINTYTINNIDNTFQNSNISVRMTTSVTCNQNVVTSNPYLLQIINGIVPTVSIKSKQGFPICQGSDAVFEVNEINISDQYATYKWFIDGIPQSNSNSTTFNAGALDNGQKVKLEYTTTFACAFPKIVNSNEFVVLTEALTAPTNLKVTTGNGLKINLSWETTPTSATQFLIERSENNNQDFDKQIFVPANQTNYIDQFGLQPLTTYFYRVRAVVDNYANCFSDFSNESGAATGISDIITNLDELNENTLTVFPNPSTNGVFNLRYLGNSTEMDIEVRNLVGQSLLKQSTQFKINEATPLDLSRLANGMYWLFVRKGNKQMVIKILRE